MSETRNSNVNAVKESITLLCRMCKYAGIFGQITPEHIRQAKFDKPEVVSVLLDFLHSLLRFQQECNEQETNSQASKSQFIIQRLRLSRYPRLSRLNTTENRITSSREILLAIVWFIHHDRTIDLIKTIAMKPVDLLDLISESSLEETSVKHSSHWLTLSMAEKSNYLTWILSQINLTTKQIMALERGNRKREIKLVEKAHSDLQCEPLLLLLFRHQHLLKQYENLIEKKTLLLQSYMKWRSVESAFWFWMVSQFDVQFTPLKWHPVGCIHMLSSLFLPAISFLVLSCFLQRSVLASAEQQNSLPLNPPLPPLPDKIQTRSPLYKVVQKRLSQLQFEFSKQEKKFHDHYSQNVDLLAALQPEQKADIDKELRRLKIHLLDPHHKPRLKSIEGAASCRIEKHGHILETSIPLNWERERMRKTNRELEEEIESLRSQASEQLIELSRNLSHVVLIPPVVPSSRLSADC